MLDILNKWKNRALPSGVMADIYDGSVWKSFLTIDGNEFLSRRYTFGLLINVDWFQPYAHVQYSVGAIYLAILNFPRQLRYRRENMVLIGVIPGPHEPSLHINALLEPLVDELLKLWKGIEMPTTEGNQVIHAALLCNSSDVPATRKVGGFVGHGALKGCSRCLRSFSTTSFSDKADYSGFNCSTWPKRSMDEHQRKGMEWKHAKTQVERSKIEREHGVRYTELLRLPYFDSARFSVIDPMHNILLGTTKLMITIWKEKSLLSTHDFERIQTQVDRFVTPPDVGRIPHKILSGFSSFTADQFKNWALIYSSIVLKPILPEVHYQCWCMFVRACRLICSRAITQNNALELHDILISFCKKFEELYGARACTPNLHLHCHLKECILDFGPASAFWLFACERLNGVLGAVSTNHHAVEAQLMKKFSSSQQALQSSRNSDLDLLLSPLYSKGSLKYDELPELPILINISVSNIEELNDKCRLLPCIKESCLSSDEHGDIESTLKFYFGNEYIRTLLLYKYSCAAQLNGEMYGARQSLHFSSSLVFARPNTTDTGAIPGFVTKYVVVDVFLNVDGTRTQKKVYLAFINWLSEHEYRYWFSHPIEVWRIFSPSLGPSCFIPVSNILCRCAHLTEKIQFSGALEENVTIVVPLNPFHGL